MSNAKIRRLQRRRVARNSQAPKEPTDVTAVDPFDYPGPNFADWFMVKDG